MSQDPAWIDRPWATHLANVTARIQNVEAPVFIETFAVPSTAPNQGALNGALVSIKANFDVKGYHSSAGTTLLGKEPAQQDATAVRRLKDAGATLLGHTNMTELAYSGVGLNPHYGTPKHPTMPERIPGGSTSGGAVSVALELADIALGTDTGGSLRIPAAFCGLVGFKPSRQTVPNDGCWPLSTTLDSIGPIAQSVETCRTAWQVLSGEPPSELTRPEISSLRWVIPSNFGFDQCDEAVLRRFDAAVQQLEQAGFAIERRALDVFETYQRIPVWQFSAVECRRFYGDKLDLKSAHLDPRVRQRIARADTVSDAQFEATLAQRDALMSQLQHEYPNTVFLLPTVACLPPKFEAFDSDEAFDQINLLCLRNTTFANVIDGCSVSLPIGGELDPVGLMLTMQQGEDSRLLALAQDIQNRVIER